MSEPNPFSIGSSIPVLRMHDEAKTRAYYVDFLGYLVDWEHRFQPSPESPLYMQVRLGDSVLHLNGHASKDTPATEVMIPVKQLQEFCDHLGQRCQSGEKPVCVDPRYEGRNTDMNLIDPSGNTLTFWLDEK